MFQFLAILVQHISGSQLLWSYSFACMYLYVTCR